MRCAVCCFIFPNINVPSTSRFDNSVTTFSCIASASSTMIGDGKSQFAFEYHFLCHVSIIIFIIFIGYKSPCFKIPAMSYFHVLFPCPTFTQSANGRNNNFHSVVFKERVPVILASVRAAKMPCPSSFCSFYFHIVRLK